LVLAKDKVAQCVWLLTGNKSTLTKRYKFSQ